MAKPSELRANLDRIMGEFREKKIAWRDAQTEINSVIAQIKTYKAEDDRVKLLRSLGTVTTPGKVFNLEG